MKVIHYGTEKFSVAHDIADMVAIAAEKFAEAGHYSGLTVACYWGPNATTVEILVGAGIPILVTESFPPDDREDPPRTYECSELIRSQIRSLTA